MGHSGRAYFDANFEMNRQVQVLIDHLMDKKTGGENAL